MPHCKSIGISIRTVAHSAQRQNAHKLTFHARKTVVGELRVRPRRLFLRRPAARVSASENGAKLALSRRHRGVGL